MIIGIIPVKTTTSDAFADSAIISLVAISNAFVANVLKLKGLKINVSGNSFKISTNASKIAAAILLRIKGRSIFHSVLKGEAPNERATSFTEAPVFWKPASIAL